MTLEPQEREPGDSRERVGAATSASDTVPVPLLARDDALAAARAVGLDEQMAGLSVFRVLLHNPIVAGPLSRLLSTLLWEGALDARLRELVIMRIGWATDAEYEWTQHWRVACGLLGIPTEDVLAVRDWRASDRFGPAERAVLAATDETLEHDTISDGTWSELRDHVGGDAVLVELVVAIGNWRLFSSLLRSLRVPLEDGVQPWPPDGRRPHR